MTPDFWNDSKEAEKTLLSIKSKKVWTDSYQKTMAAIDDLAVLLIFCTKEILVSRK